MGRALVLFLAFAVSALAQESPGAFDQRMDRGRRALAEEDWLTAAQSFGLALRERPGDPDAAASLKRALREVEVYNTRFEPLRGRTMERYASARSREAIDAGLAWLVHRQAEDGHWTNTSSQGHARDDLAPTAFALLALLADGSCEVEGPHADAVRRGIAWILARQQPNGSYGGVTHYSEGLAALAVVEAFAMGGTDATFLSAQKSLNHVVGSRCPNGGWLYLPSTDDGQGDVSVTGMMFQPLKQAQMVYLDFSYDTLRETADWIDRITFEDGAVPYRPGQAAPHHAPSLAAIGTLVRMYAGDSPGSTPRVAHGIETVLAHREEMKTNLYFLYYGTMLAFLAGGETWETWNPMMLDHLLARQAKEGADAGLFWDADEYWVKLGYIDPVLYQSMAILSLECCYRYVPRPMVPID